MSKGLRTYLPFKLRTMDFLETSGTDYPLTQHRVPEINGVLSYAAVEKNQNTHHRVVLYVRALF